MRKGVLTVWLAVALLVSIAPSQAWHLLHDHSPRNSHAETCETDSVPSLPTENPLTPEQDDTCPLCHSFAAAHAGVLSDDAATFPEDTPVEFLAVRECAWQPIEAPRLSIARGPPAIETIA
ncbi:MAG: hypothetical protein ACF8GE_03670 [Phycisphaerales bacterium JB043]